MPRSQQNSELCALVCPGIKEIKRLPSPQLSTPAECRVEGQTQHLETHHSSKAFKFEKEVWWREQKIPHKKDQSVCADVERALAFCTRGTWLLLNAAADGIRSERHSERL